ncbi:hypothetical protein F7725_007130 [Dissostichus mawsoni]|uniref:Uncharacterized protein n=1 Tax=Dissostichus mawsoni TaxID=36200 RepID=A0A7J5XYU3_DISMA|nr:hypothetical protein F7725_007130 [Dissostichus mawsoni]
MMKVSLFIGYIICSCLDEHLALGPWLDGGAVDGHGLAIPARSTLLTPDRSVLKTFIFSTRVMRAVSVASPTFSYTPLACGRKNANCFIEAKLYTVKIKALPLTLQTDIWLVVRVPVLSEQITEVQPRVSTDGRLRTMAFFLAMRRVPRARQVVMTAGRPSGMAATARATAILK